MPRLAIALAICRLRRLQHSLKFDWKEMKSREIKKKWFGWTIIRLKIHWSDLSCAKFCRVQPKYFCVKIQLSFSVPSSQSIDCIDANWMWRDIGWSGITTKTGTNFYTIWMSSKNVFKIQIFKHFSSESSTNFILFCNFVQIDWLKFHFITSQTFDKE